MEGVMCGWVDGGGRGCWREKEHRQREAEGRNANNFVAIKCNKSHQSLGLTRVHVIIDSILKGTVHGPLVFTHHLLHPLGKSETNVQVLRTHTPTHCPYT